jgi:hypothetical protein
MASSCVCSRNDCLVLGHAFILFVLKVYIKYKRVIWFSYCDADEGGLHFRKSQTTPHSGVVPRFLINALREGVIEEAEEEEEVSFLYIQALRHEGENVGIGKAHVQRRFLFWYYQLMSPLTFIICNPQPKSKNTILPAISCY